MNLPIAIEKWSSVGVLFQDENGEQTLIVIEDLSEDMELTAEDRIAAHKFLTEKINDDNS